MEHNEHALLSKIAPALIEAKKEFGKALKDKTNPHFKSKYADLGACLEAVDDALLKHGIALVQQTFESDSGVTVETVFIHSSGQTIRGGKLHVPASKHDPQGYGSALTYARRYSLQAACGIAPEDDDGNAATQRFNPRLEALIEQMNEASDIASLKDVFTKAWKISDGSNSVKGVYEVNKDRINKGMGNE